MARFAQRLLAWYEREQRDLPWRATRDPWAIWISEVMLQQTRVEVVRQLWPAFLARFPTPAALAVASDDELLSAWKGLGYYRRARLLRDAARVVVDRHGGAVPATLDALRQLPGIGTYTAGALASIAFQQPELAIDGNVERVVARHLALDTNVKIAPASARIRDVVLGWLDPERPGDFNQALMELGAVVCTPRAPRCPVCPVADDCLAQKQQRQDQLPVLPERRALVDVESRAVLVPVRGGRLLGTRLAKDQINGGQIDLPGQGLLVPCTSPQELIVGLRRLYGVAFEVGEVVTTIRHTITNHRIRLIVHAARGPRGPGPNLVAARPDDSTVPWTTAARKTFQQAALFLAALGG